VEEQLPTPPANAEEWSDEQWIAWLKATDAEPVSGEHSAPVTTGGRVAHSPGGQILGDAMTGLAQALYGPQKKKPPVIAESGEPDADQPFDLHLDFNHPERSYVTRKPVPPSRDSDAD
jgi:hypothetical protein